MSNLKILHLSDGTIDDLRIIKAASTGKKAGYTVYFSGEKPKSKFSTDIFEDVNWIKIPNRARVSELIHGFNFWPFYPYPSHAESLQKQIKSTIEMIRPDIIHAHNIFVAYHSLSFGIPIVLDDHELYSVEIMAKNQNANAKKKIISKIKKRLWKKWEQIIGKQYPIITVSKKISEHHKKYCKNVFLVPNFPLKDSIQMAKFNEATKSNLTSVYLGNDPNDGSNPIRDIRSLHEIFYSSNIGNLKRIGVSSPNDSKIQSYGFVPMKEAYQIMQNHCHIGLLPWRPFWFHEYCCPNKVYEYAHNGLWLITTDDLYQVVDDFGENCDKFDSYEKLTSLLDYYYQHPEELNKKRHQILDFAKKNLIWENNEKRILDAYKIA